MTRFDSIIIFKCLRWRPFLSTSWSAARRFHSKLLDDSGVRNVSSGVLRSKDVVT